MALTVNDVPDRNRFEARDDETIAGYAEYIRTNAGLIVFTHTEVNREYEGQGVGSALAEAGLDYARAEGLSVLPICPFIASWISRHPDSADLLYRAPTSNVTD
jgi:predicted GNAT family acetyltransferase